MAHLARGDKKLPNNIKQYDLHMLNTDALQNMHISDTTLAYKKIPESEINT